MITLCWLIRIGGSTSKLSAYFCTKSGSCLRLGYRSSRNLIWSIGLNSLVLAIYSSFTAAAIGTVSSATPKLSKSTSIPKKLENQTPTQYNWEVALFFRWCGLIVQQNLTKQNKSILRSGCLPSTLLFLFIDCYTYNKFQCTKLNICSHHLLYYWLNTLGKFISTDDTVNKDKLSTYLTLPPTCRFLSSDYTTLDFGLKRSR